MDMAPQVPGDRTPYSASSSGKLKARSTMSMKRSGGGGGGTPYERPGSAARRAAQPLAQRDAGWIGGGIGAGIVHSASRILTKSAVFLFNSMFKRQAPAITAPPGDSAMGSEDVPPLEVAQESERNDMIIAPAEGEAKVSGSASLQAADLENILKQKNLTREECERYITLIQSKIMDSTPEPGPSSPAASDRHLVYRSSRTMFSPENQRSETQRETAQALVAWEEPPVRRAPEDRRVRFQQPQARSERWTPIQMPIAGGRELLKQRATVSSDKSPASKEVSPSRASFSLRGPSLVPGPTLKRKTSSDAMDLTCFRSATTKRKSSLRLDVPSIPGQSSRTAQRILESLERRSAFKKPVPMPEPEPELKAHAPSRPPRARVSALKTTPAVAAGNLAFSFPATANGPEPPTPKPMPSPCTQDKKARDEQVEPNHVRNGLFSSFQDSGFDKLPLAPFSNGPESSSLFSAEVAFERIVQRVEKASSILSGGDGARAPSLTNSPSFSNGVGFPSDLTSSSSSRWDEPASTNPFQNFSSGGSLTGTLAALTPNSSPSPSTTAAAVTCSSAGVEMKESLFDWKPAPSSFSSDQVWLGAAQSLAPPDSAAPPSNGGAAKRKKSTKRLK